MMNLKLVQAALLAAGLMVGGAAGASDAHGTHWGYSGDTGPAHWGDLSPDYHLCKAGKNQSPVDIDGTVAAELGAVAPHYTASPLEILNNGHTIQVNLKGSTLEADGKSFQLLQFHFHSPSEHEVAGKAAPLEGHLVHKNEAGQLAVIGVLFKEGKENALLKTLWAHMPKQAGETITDEKVEVNPADLLPADLSYYRYSGSLTTPPCSEGVSWFVMKEPLEASREQIDAFLAVIHENARPVQPVEARKLLKSH